MKTFKVLLTRSYIVTINAQDKKMARELSEFYLCGCQDFSTPDDRKKRNFSITDIEMTINEAFDAEEISIDG